MTVTASQTTDWLNELGCDGVTLSLRELVYYQARAHLLDLTPSRLIKHRMAGQYLAPHKGRGMEFAEVRHYQNGDDVRSIDWRVTARTGVAHTKLYQEEKERPVYVVSDFSDSMLFGTRFVLKSIQTAHIAAMIAWSASRRGDRVGGLTFNSQNHYEAKPGSRQNAVLRLIHQLIECHGESRTAHAEPDYCPFNEQLQRLNQMAKPGSLVYLISDFSKMNEQSAKQLQNLTRHCEVIAVRVSDPFELSLPKYHDDIHLDTSENITTLALSSASFRDTYKKHVTAYRDKTHHQLTRLGINVIDITSAMPLTEQLVSRG